MRRRNCSIRHGFTLIEALVSITILSTMGSLASSIIFTSVDAYTEAAVSAQLHAEESVAMDRITRELRETPRDTSFSGTAPMISAVTPTSINWDTNYSLTLAANQLMFVDNGAPAEVILDDVSAFTIQTYDESNAALAGTLAGPACAPIRRIEISISVQRSGVTQTIRTKLYIRATMSGAGS